MVFPVEHGRFLRTGAPCFSLGPFKHPFYWLNGGVMFRFGKCREVKGR